jgi:hypothetical protein
MEAFRSIITGIAILMVHSLELALPELLDSCKVPFPKQ